MSDKSVDLGQWLKQWHRYIMGFAKRVDRRIDREQAYWIVLGGVYEAWAKFDPSRECSFQSYATFWMRRAVDVANKGLQTQKRSAKVFSIDALDVSASESHFIVCEDSPGEWERADEFEPIRKALARINPKDREVLEQRFGLNGSDPMGMRELGRALGVSWNRVQQREIRGLKDLRYFLGVEGPAAA